MQNNYADQRNQNAEYAGFWVRLAAYCIDLAIVWIGLLFIKLVIGIISMAGGNVFQTRLLFRYTLKDIILYVFQVLYFILLTYHTGTTLGKRLLNLRVVHANGDQQLGLINVIYRETVGRFLCGLSVGIGYIMAGVDREKKGLHDMLCDTRVIYGKKIKVFPKYQVPNMYPPIPPVPPVPVPPYGGAPQGNRFGPIPPQGNPPQGNPLQGDQTQMKGSGILPPQGNSLQGDQTRTKGSGILPPQGNPLQENSGREDTQNNESAQNSENTLVSSETSPVQENGLPSGEEDNK